MKYLKIYEQFDFEDLSDEEIFGREPKNFEIGDVVHFTRTSSVRWNTEKLQKNKPLWLDSTFFSKEKWFVVTAIGRVEDMDFIKIVAYNKKTIGNHPYQFFWYDADAFEKV